MSFRLIEEGDYDKGIFSLYSQLSHGRECTRQYFNSFVESLNTNHNIYVLEEDNKIIVCATFVIESKLIRGGSRIMHIEDIVVDKYNRGRGLGLEIVKLLVEKSKTMGCYKAILNCADEYIDFYKKNGFTAKGCHMAVYH